jgi:hypothetical protein
MAFGVIFGKVRVDVISVRGPRWALPYRKRGGTYESFDIEIGAAVWAQRAVDLQPAGLVSGALLSMQHTVLDSRWKSEGVTQRAICIRARQCRLPEAVESRCRRRSPGLLIPLRAPAAEHAQDQEEGGATCSTFDSSEVFLRPGRRHIVSGFDQGE